MVISEYSHLLFTLIAASSCSFSMDGRCHDVRLSSWSLHTRAHLPCILSSPAFFWITHISFVNKTVECLLRACPCIKPWGCSRGQASAAPLSLAGTSSRKTPTPRIGQRACLCVLAAPRLSPSPSGSCCVVVLVCLCDHTPSCRGSACFHSWPPAQGPLGSGVL